jgi:DNA-binding response OmpR family regulator
MKILYLEDDIVLAETVEEYLLDEGFEVDTVYDGEEALENIYKKRYDLLLLDVNVPSINGFELLKILRDANILTSAIFTTSLNSIDDLSKGYSVGADDYLKKPFILKELLFRIHALLKREYKLQNDIITLSHDTIFNTQTNELFIKKTRISLNLKETLLLKLFLKHKNECISFETIFQNVWSYDEIHSDMSLRTYIKTLRKHLGKERILSIKKVGYKFV